MWRSEEHRPDGNAGFSLMESIVSLWLASLLLLMGGRVLWSLWIDQNRQLAYLEADAQWSQLTRVVSQDVHAASAVGVNAGNLMVWMTGGKVYRYALNGTHEYVRIQEGGGSAVVASDIENVVTSANGGLVTQTVWFNDGTSRQYEVACLSSWLD